MVTVKEILERKEKDGPRNTVIMVKWDDGDGTDITIYKNAEVAVACAVKGMDEEDRSALLDLMVEYHGGKVDDYLAAEPMDFIRLLADMLDNGEDVCVQTAELFRGSISFEEVLG